jgi:hypothetical protein
VIGGGILQYAVEASHVQAFLDCSHEVALEIVCAAHEYDVAQAEAPSNVIYGVDFVNKRPKVTTGTL